MRGRSSDGSSSDPGTKPPPFFSFSLVMRETQVSDIRLDATGSALAASVASGHHHDRRAANM